MSAASLSGRARAREGGSDELVSERLRDVREGGVDVSAETIAEAETTFALPGSAGGGGGKGGRPRG